MKKKILSGILALALALGALPAAAFADEVPPVLGPVYAAETENVPAAGGTEQPVAVLPAEPDSERTTSSAPDSGAGPTSVQEAPMAPVQEGHMPESPPPSPEPLASKEVELFLDGKSQGLMTMGKAAGTINYDESARTALIQIKVPELKVNSTYQFLNERIAVTIDGAYSTGYCAKLTPADGFEGYLIAGASGNSLELSDVLLDGGAVVTTGKGQAPVWEGRKRRGPLVSVNGTHLVLSGSTTLQNSWNESQGGAVTLQNGASLTMKDDSVIRNCKSDIAGGAVYATGTYVVDGRNTLVTLEKARIEGNAAQNGGGIYLTKGARLVTAGKEGRDVQITGNSAENGGGIYADGNVHSLNLVYMSGNKAGSDGGAIYAVNGAKLTSTSANHEIHENEAAGRGGAIYASGGGTNVSLSLTSLQKNKAANGGAVYVANSAAFTANTAQFKENNAAENGGAVYVAGGNVTMQQGSGGYDDPEHVNSGLLRNSAGGSGGAVYAVGTGSTVSLGTVGVYYNESKALAGALYLTDGATATLNGTDVRGNTGAENGAPANLWVAETSCGGIYVDEESALKLSGKLTVTGNTVGSREVNLLINSADVAPGGGQNTPVECYWDYGGLNTGSQIGVSMSTWPQASSENSEILHMIGKTYLPSSGAKDGISEAYAAYFVSDRAPYNAEIGSGTFETVVRKANHPDAQEKEYHQVYLKAYPEAPNAPVPSASVQDKYFDGTNSVSLSVLTWSNVPEADETLFSCLTEGTDYTCTAVFTDNETGSVAWKDGEVQAQNVQVSLTILNETVLEKYPDFAKGLTLTTQAKIYPIPLTAAADVNDKYYDAAVTASGSATLSVDKASEPVPGLALPDTLPKQPVQDVDYTLTALFDTASAGSQKGARVRLTANETDLAGSYIWPDQPLVVNADILPLPVVVHFEVNDKVHDGNANATLKGTPKLTLGEAASGTPALPDRLPEKITYGSDYELTELKFVDSDGAAVSAVGTHKVTAVMEVLNANKMANYEVTLDSASAQIKGVELTASANVPDKTYDGTTKAEIDKLTVVLSKPDGGTLVQGRDFTVMSAEFFSKNVGDNVSATVKIRLSDANAEIYTIRQSETVVTGTDGVTAITTAADVNHRSVKLESAVADSKRYDGNRDAAVHDLVFSGVAENEQFTADDYIIMSQSFDSAVVGNGKTVTVTVALAENSKTKNYILEQSTVYTQADITPWHLAAALAVQDKPYDSTTNVAEDEYSITFTDTDLHQTVTLVSGTDYRVVSAPTFDSKNAGERMVSMTIELIANASKPYDLENGTLTASAQIEKLPLVPKDAHAPSKVYDGTAEMVESDTDKASVTLTGGLKGEDFQQGRDYVVASGEFLSKNSEAPKDAAASKPVVLTVALVENELTQNYYLSPAQLTASADIDKRPLTPASVTVDNKEYDGSDTAAAHGLVLNGTLETEHLQEGVDYRIKEARFNNADVGNDKPVYVKLETLDTAVMRNYVLTADHIEGKASITAKAPAPTPSAPVNSGTAASVGVQTGDSFPILLLAIALALACTAIAVLLIVEHRRKHDGK